MIKQWLSIGFFFNTAVVAAKSKIWFEPLEQIKVTSFFGTSMEKFSLVCPVDSGEMFTELYAQFEKI